MLYYLCETVVLRSRSSCLSRVAWASSFEDHQHHFSDRYFWERSFDIEESLQHILWWSSFCMNQSRSLCSVEEDAEAKKARYRSEDHEDQSYHIDCDVLSSTQESWACTIERVEYWKERIVVKALPEEERPWSYVSFNKRVNLNVCNFSHRKENWYHRSLLKEADPFEQEDQSRSKKADRARFERKRIEQIFANEIDLHTIQHSIRRLYDLSDAAEFRSLAPISQAHWRIREENSMK